MNYFHFAFKITVNKSTKKCSLAKDTYVFTHVGHKFISNRAIWNKYASMGSLFFQKHCANPCGAYK